jgi:hypothetical protein
LTPVAVREGAGVRPLATSTSPGSEVQRPLATVVIGGLSTSTLLTMIVLPVVYQWLEERWPEWAARTGAYFSLAPFFGAAISLVVLREPIGSALICAGALMAVGAWLHLT